MIRRQTAGLLGVIVLLGVALRSYHLGARSLWFDEAFSWRLIQFPLPELLTRAAADVHPPLYYILLKLWASIFDTSLLSLRLFSVAGAATTILAAYVFTAYASNDRRAGLIAALLVAVSPFQIQFAWEARMYTLGTTLALASSYGLLRAVRRNKGWGAYVALAAAFAYTHYFALFTLAAHAVFILLQRSRRRQPKVYLAAALVLLLYLPQLPILLQQNAQVQQNYWIPPLKIWSLPNTIYHMFVPANAFPPALLGALATGILGLALIISLMAFWVRRQRSLPRDVRHFLSATILVPFALAAAISAVSQSLYLDRFFIFTHVFMLAGLALLAVKLSARSRVLTTTLLIAGFLVAFAARWQELDIPHKGGMQDAVAFISTYQPTSPIIVSSPFVYFSALHHVVEKFPHVSPPRLYTTTGELVHFAGGPIQTVEDIVGPSFLTQDHAALWVIDTTGFGQQPLAPDPAWVVQHQQHFPEVFPHQGEIIATHYVTRPVSGSKPD